MFGFIFHCDSIQLKLFTDFYKLYERNGFSRCFPLELIGFDNLLGVENEVESSVKTTFCLQVCPLL